MNTQNVNAVDIFNIPPQPGEINLVDFVISHLNANEATSESNVFMVDAMIKSIYKLNANSQRVIINKYLLKSLLHFRTIVKKEVIDVISFLANDGLMEDWITLMKEFVIPFIATNKVLTTITK